MDNPLNYNIVVIGDMGVGKSCIMQRYVKNAFIKPYISSLGCDYYYKTIKVNNKQANLSITDMTGATDVLIESHISNFFMDAMGVVLVYDITRSRSFENLIGRYNDAASYTNFATAFIVVGNKCDLIYEREVDIVSGEFYAKSNGFLFMETSALYNYKLNETFQKLADEMYLREHGSFNDIQNQRVKRENKPLPRNVEPSSRSIVDANISLFGGRFIWSWKWNWWPRIPYRCGLGRR